MVVLLHSLIEITALDMVAALFQFLQAELFGMSFAKSTSAQRNRICGPLCEVVDLIAGDCCCVERLVSSYFEVAYKLYKIRNDCMFSDT